MQNRKRLHATTQQLTLGMMSDVGLQVFNAFHSDSPIQDVISSNEELYEK